MGFTALFTFIGGLLSKLGVKGGLIEVAKWAAFKIVLVTVFVAGLAILLNNFVITFVTDFLTSAATELTDGNLQSAVIELTGLAAYLGNLFKLPQSLSVIISGVSIGAIRKFIPFLG